MSKRSAAAGAPTAALAGNHDTGIGFSFCAHCRARFSAQVSPVNFHLTVGNVSLLGLDTVPLAPLLPLPLPLLSPSGPARAGRDGWAFGALLLQRACPGPRGGERSTGVLCCTAGGRGARRGARRRLRERKKMCSRRRLQGRRAGAGRREGRGGRTQHRGLPPVQRPRAGFPAPPPVLTGHVSSFPPY